MTLLVDTNQVLISALLSQVKSNQYMDEGLIRHIALNSLCYNTKKFKEYGDVVLCCDSRTYWRKEFFPHYKAHRKTAREKSNLDWNTIFKVLNQLKEDFKQYFPYKTIEVDGAEADDIIGTLTPRLASSEKVLILSSDADFKQLHKFDNVKQFNPMLNVFVKSKNPVKELKEKVIRGDFGDGIPNVLSSDDIFVIGKRQASIYQKKLDVWLESDLKEVLTEEQYNNYMRNDTLINFEHIPKNIREAIIEQYETAQPNPRNHLYKYFVTNKLVNLLDSLEDF